ncbi:putative ATP-binding protein [Actinacidiphila reveromycinica]|uniref:Putative ATP-binding protein n=1 Tax=Actinacidiphila reveromycinica TaxID=659352 RepID=A0A7U3UW47_9ACTN|nr:putative ATP-binding protein [Streptomyces sp. SN-593]
MSPPSRSRVILLAGPSGSGKSSLAARTGLPVLALDDFYKEDGDPTLPLLPGGDAVDWDAPASWHADAAVAAIAALCAHGSARTPRYDISASAISGWSRLDLAGAPHFVAEGIFAAEIVARCRDLGLLADAICLRGSPATTARRRFVRDLREGRKSVRFLLRRGWALFRAERAIVTRQVGFGCAPCDQREALSRLAALGAAEPAPAAGPAGVPAVSPAGGR